MRVIRRKKGRNRYFYLQHSFRIKGKPVTKEVYLGRNIPKDIEKIRDSLRKEAKKELYEKLDKIKKNFQNEWKISPASAKRKQEQEIAIAFTYNTNAIEGSTITLEETREIVKDKIAPNKPLYDIKETEAHYRVFLEMLCNGDKITKRLILKWHKELFSETKKEIAGTFREHLVRVGDYVAPDWQDVKKLMNDFVKYLERKDMNPVELAARAHYRFEKIHPFSDGNGRVGRLLMNKVLWDANFPMLIIEYKRRKSYYKALKRGEDNFADYFLRRYLAAHRKRLR